MGGKGVAVQLMEFAQYWFLLWGPLANDHVHIIVCLIVRQFLYFKFPHYNRRGHTTKP